jgi:hypothetical protein
MDAPLHAAAALQASRRRVAPAKRRRSVKDAATQRAASRCGSWKLYAIKDAIDGGATYQSDTSTDVPKPAALALMGRYNTLHQLPRSIRRSAIQNELFYCVIYWAGLALSCQLHYTQ